MQLFNLFHVLNVKIDIRAKESTINKEGQQPDLHHA
jgi:hypothetical protein